MSAKLGGYYADRGGMFMAADLKRSRRVKVVVSHVMVEGFEDVVGDEGSVRRSSVGLVRHEVTVRCDVSPRDIHRMSMTVIR